MLLEKDFITFPMRPINGARLESAQPKIGDWVFDLKANGQRLLINTRTRQCWNRHGKFTEKGMRAEYDHAINALCDAFPDVEWLDAEGFLRRHKTGKGSITVLDAILPGVPLMQRYELLKRLPEIPATAPEIQGKAIYRIPRFPWSDIDSVYGELRAANIKLGLAATFEGVVAKSLDDVGYLIQKRNDTHDTVLWHKHRFV